MVLFNWLYERGRDIVMWPLNFVRDLPGRTGRLFNAFSPRLARPFKWRLHTIACYLFDLVGGPEFCQFWMHLVMPTSPLTAEEIEKVSSVLGPNAIRYQDIRISQGGILPWIFSMNNNRAFALWHSIFLPYEGRHSRENVDLLVHESTHVFQFETIGSIYIGEALAAQIKLGKDAYDYGGPAGLFKASKDAKPYASFNREQQAQIAQHYFALRESEHDVSAYQPYIAALRQAMF